MTDATVTAKTSKKKSPEKGSPKKEAPKKEAADNTSLAHPTLLKAITKKGYDKLTPVQSAVIAPELDGRDLLVSAQTGSGKTVAFGLAMASTIIGEGDQLPPADTPLALAIAPTRELALQVKKELDWLYREAGAKTTSCVGGMDMRDERRTLARGVHIVVGTPGRLCDHIKRGSLDMSGLKSVILDEADEMLKMGFREELELILAAAPEDRQTLMFSATVAKPIVAIARKYQRDAVRVNTAAEARQHNDIDYRALTVRDSDKEKAIINLLRYYDAKNAIVFGDTRVSVNRMVSRFNNRGFSVVALSGELNQSQRSAALQALRDGRAKVCIATDVAARGLDLPDLELVIHADVPKNREALLHRSGRTGRAGRKGTSALIVPHKRVRYVERLLKTANVQARWTPPPSAEQVLERDSVRMIESMVLVDPIADEERETVTKILAQYSPEHIASAFIRQYRQGRSAPEELLDVPEYTPGKGGHDGPREKRERKPRQDFENGIWYSLNLGRKQRAEPRWILPMLSKSGDLKKHEIGAIKISERETFVEIAPSGLERFVKAIGPDGKIEKAITARRIEGKPDLTGRSGSAHDEFVQDHPPRKHRKGTKENFKNDKFGGDKKPWKKDAVSKPDGMKASKPKKAKKPFDAESYAKKKGRVYDPNDDGQRMDPDQTTDTWSEDIPKAKKPHKKKLARAAARAAAGKSAPVQGKKTGPKGGEHPPKRTGKSFDGAKGKPKFGGKPKTSLKRKPRK